ncbi:hypothetical protein WA026_000094 [Henosepilachna vigintioctopunctata]|uniref:Uncharacterized protein n=1 Tax=Henosepilachna vigintioctopunctata TaxID=420089 RepID=A0AAW1UXC1_9CUCU
MVCLSDHRKRPAISKREDPQEEASPQRPKNHGRGHIPNRLITINRDLSDTQILLSENTCSGQPRPDTFRKGRIDRWSFFQTSDSIEIGRADPADLGRIRVIVTPRRFGAYEGCGVAGSTVFYAKCVSPNN